MQIIFHLSVIGFKSIPVFPSRPNFETHFASRKLKADNNADYFQDRETMVLMHMVLCWNFDSRL